eukprot:gnl/MRDRNA2_/MRDRNA2_29009_c0_seq2.p1 gnl/MRDRNA2_/MRDRNA2_29009_c0~~gnl/MRDRNA2_/MRDRNA2_29009_c0_seq2.p1  ORF type:complete len:469 (+),score=99.16 gnl/MRDRNA2_/MRDRNA2_29009_c0_seq2:147-1553(+)
MFFAGDGFNPQELTRDNENEFMQKPSGPFGSQLGFNSNDVYSNDPYRETTDALRGVPMAQFGSWSGSMYKTSNDPYAEDDDVVRGCSIAQPPAGLPDVFYGKQMEDGMAAGYFGQFMPFHEMPSKDGAYSSMHSPPVPLEASASFLRFQQDDEPPTPPNSDNFCLEATALYLTTREAHKIGNSILDFFDSQIVASVLKVRQQKYSIKVHWFLDHIMCTAKIRIWKVASEQNQYAIEFQRRGGDPFAFAEGYRQCMDFLALRFPENAAELTMLSDGERKRSLPQPPPPPLPAETQSCKRSDEELDTELFTLLDLAGMTEFPNLQGEAASALAKLACDDMCIATYLSKVCVLDKLLPLLSCDSIDVIYPTARMLSAVAATSTSSIAEHSIAKEVIKKIGDSNSNQLVRLELAKAVSQAVLCPHFISVDQAQELHHLLEFTIQDLNGVPATEVVRRTLQDTLFQLKPYCTA